MKLIPDLEKHVGTDSGLLNELYVDVPLDMCFSNVQPALSP